MTDFLLELRSEEIPARMQDDARQNLIRQFESELAKAGLKAEAIAKYATPRRLALIAQGLPLETNAKSEEIKGPKVGAPPQALEGFLRKTGLTQEQLVERDGVYFAVIEQPGRKTVDVLAEAIPAIIRGFSWPKSMRWGEASISTESLRWVRPLQGIVALLGDNVVACEIDGIISGRETVGHRFHSSGTISITNAGSYEDQLLTAKVWLSQDQRREDIRAKAEKAAADAGLTLVPDDGLVTENAGLTEWPVPLLGHFDAAFLSVPPEVIQLTMRTNQKYFACKTADGALANAFICTSNIAAHDGGKAIIAGNEKVLAARLSDAKFFWEQDLKVPLAQQAEKLRNIVFHEKLGTVADKVQRVAKLARWLVESGVIRNRAPGEDPEPIGSASSAEHNAQLADFAEQAAHLCKADLVTGMVGEFPELQGVMGGYYARHEGLPDAVADAIRDHYKPVGQGDDVPTAPVTVAVSLADKLDTLAQFFAFEMPPTGSKDPYALRRAALSALQLIIENNLRVRLFGVISRQIDYSGPRLPDIVADEVMTFFVERLKVQQREVGTRHDLIAAVFAALSTIRDGKTVSGTGDDDLIRVLARVHALQAFIETPDGVNLLAGYKRAANILKQNLLPVAGEGAERSEAGEGDRGSSTAPSPSAPNGAPPSPARGEGMTDADSALLTALDSAEPRAQAAIAAEDFATAMSALASLRAPIDQFFADVMVNDPDATIRAFRLGLLARFRDAVHKVADFSKIEG